MCNDCKKNCKCKSSPITLKDQGYAGILLLDLDGTIFSNWQRVKHLPQSLKNPTQEEWAVFNSFAADDAPLQENYDHAVQVAKFHNLAIVACTMRNESSREATMEAFDRAGFTEIQGLFLRPDSAKTDIITYKKGVIDHLLETHGLFTKIIMDDNKELCDWACEFVIVERVEGNYDCASALANLPDGTAEGKFKAPVTVEPMTFGEFMDKEHPETPVKDEDRNIEGYKVLIGFEQLGVSRTDWYDVVSAASVIEF